MAHAKAAHERRLPKANVLEKTGKPLEHWYAILDKWGAREKIHKDIAMYLHKQKVSSWWSQMIAVQYERDHGLRQLNQKCDGEFSVSKSVTLNVPLGKVYAAWKDSAIRGSWLSDDSFEITTANHSKNLRGKWDHGKSRLAIGFYPKGPDKTQVALDHEKLEGVADVARWRKFWGEQMQRMKKKLEVRN